MNEEEYRPITIGTYVEGYTVEHNSFERGYLTGYALLDHTDPNSIVAVIAKDHSHEVLIKKESMKIVSRYETLLKALEEYGLKYIEGKVVGRPQPKFAPGDTARHKNYGDNPSGDITITYVDERGYSYVYDNGCGGGTFGFSGESDYNLIKNGQICN